MDVSNTIHFDKAPADPQNLSLSFLIRAENPLSFSRSALNKGGGGGGFWVKISDARVSQRKSLIAL